MSTFLGIDLGTTGCKICLIDENQRIITELSNPHNATIRTENELFSEQCPRKTVECVVDLIRQVDLSNVKAISTSGQMHGIILWDKNMDINNKWVCSNLITWMDQRCDVEFLLSLPEWKDADGNQESAICSGYGTATLAWLNRNKQIRPEWNACGTIMDFLTFLLTKKSDFMSDQLAYSFGYLGHDNQWQDNCKSILPCELLPKVVSSYHIIGKINTSLDIKCSNDVNVHIALGDLQTSLYKVLKPNQAVLHLGTSSQIAFSLDKKPKIDLSLSHLLRYPYFNGQCLVVAASLNGGNVFELLTKKIDQFSSELYGPHSTQISSDKIKLLLDQAVNKNIPLIVDPLFYGERHTPESLASLSNFGPQTSLFDLFGATAIGIIRNLSQMLPSTFMRKSEVMQIKLLNRASHPIFEKAAIELFKEIDVIIDESSTVSAAFGAASFVYDEYK